MRTVITGGAGFLGSHLCDYFLEKGHTVICLDNLLTGNTDNIAHLLGNENFRFIKHNVTEYIYIEGEITYENRPSVKIGSEFILGTTGLINFISRGGNGGNGGGGSPGTVHCNGGNGGEVW